MSDNCVNSAQNIILFDWFSLTSKCDSVDDIKSLIGLDYIGINWTSASGMHGYADRLYFNGISIHFNGNNNTVWLEMSGQGCRVFEQYSTHKSWHCLIDLVINNPEDYNLTRLDVAYDDWQGFLNINKICKECEKNNLLSKFRNYGVERSFTKSDMTIYFGSKKSDVLFRCYNKAAERGREEEINHWIRFEMQLRDNYALNFLKEYYKNNSIGLTFCGVLSNYIRFIVPSDTESNKSRLKTRKWWSDFIGDCSKISLFTKKETDYNFYHLHEYVCNMAGNAIDTFIKIKGVDQLQKSLKSRRSSLSEKYLRLISDCKLANDIIDNSDSIEACLDSASSVGLL